ncbi:MAG TPA: phosphate ABC transporter substrate-binding protein [Planctomycetota bacterium]|nr:phosphate ABC transporter substrate-binding protein [Planctomycetota bacterium]
MKTTRPAKAALWLAIVGALAGIARGQAAPVKVDGDIPSYKTVSGISGNLSSVGSDTMNNLMALWGETFKKFYPNVNIQIEGKGSGTAIPALIAGAAQIGPMSRPPKDTEADLFEKKFGYKPLVIRTSVDALAIFLNKDNPLKSLSLAQADAIFSKSRRRNNPEITTWGQLGLTGEWAEKPISIYGRNSASGTYGFFKEHTLKNGDFKDEVKEQPGSAAVVQAVGQDKFAIGYSGIGYATSGVRAVPLVESTGGEAVEANAENAYSGAYPLARFLYVAVNKPPSKSMDPLTHEFLKLILSKEGQESVVKDGYFPIPAPLVKEDLKRVE